MRKRARILVIDDEEFFYQTLFKKDGYNIDKWNDVLDLQKLESGYYDIILLDIQGVAKKISSDQGLGLLKHLNKVSPAQIIIAYSNADWSLKYQEFFKLADATLAKGKDYIEFKQTVDLLLSRRFSIDFYIDRAVSLAGASVVDHAKLKEIVSSSKRKNSPDKASKQLSQITDNKDVIEVVVRVIQVAVQIMQILTGLNHK